jgi:hypothetical protein
MKRFLLNALICFTAFGFVASVPAAASSAQGKVSRVYMVYGVAMILLDTPPRAGVPACGAGNGTRWAFNATTPAGQAMLSVILTAYASGRPVSIYGTNTCLDWGDTESIEWMHSD